MIKDVLIVGFGGVGAVYASKISDNGVNVLTDKKRLEYYTKNPTFINGEKFEFNYITPDKAFPVDLIIIAVKYYNLPEILEPLKSFIKPDTKIISLINGISSEYIIKQRYPEADVIPSYLICNSIIKTGRSITHDGVNKIVMGKDKSVTEFFDKYGINYEVSEDIKSAMWQKFMLNIIANQLSAVTHKTFGEMNELPFIESLLYKILDEVVLIAKSEGINNPELLAKNAVKTFRGMAPYGKTSMLQDIENNRPTEIDAFAGYITELGEKYNIKTPYNTLFKYLIMI